MSYNILMKLTLLLLTLILSTAQANLGTYKDGRFIYPNTNKPYTGSLDILNNDWGKDVVELSKDYVNGLQHGNEKVFYRTGRLKSLAKYINGKVEGAAEFYYDDGTLADEVDYFDGKVIERVVG
jgi:antitoxin component YwqK of YwqJK toxin-antitoxin module